MLVVPLAEFFDLPDVPVIDAGQATGVVGVKFALRVGVPVKLLHDDKVVALKSLAEVSDARRRVFADDLVDRDTRTRGHIHRDQKLHIILQW